MKMTGRQVPAVKTPITIPAMAQVLAQAHLEVTGRALPRTWVVPALAVLAFENADGRAVVAHNWGNIMAGGTWPGDWWARPTSDTNQPTRFRAYPSHIEGAKGWWSLILHARRYEPLRAALDSGDPETVGRAVHQTGYFVASRRPGMSDGDFVSSAERQNANYVRGVVARADLVRRELGQGATPASPALPGAPGYEGKPGGTSGGELVLLAWALSQLLSPVVTVLS